MVRRHEGAQGPHINIASAHGLVASAQKVAYVSPSTAVGLTKVVALETAINGVTCNAICPLGAHGAGGKAINARKLRQSQKRSQLSEKQPMHQFTKPESIGALAVFLCSDGAASITGSAYSIDGGWVAQ